MRYLSVIRQKSPTERNETDTCALTDSKRVHVIDPTISLLSDFLTDSLPSHVTHVIAALSGESYSRKYKMHNKIRKKKQCFVTR